MKKSYLLFIALLSLMAFKPVNKPKDRVLIFSLTKGFHHASIADGIAAITQWGTEIQFDTDTTTDPAKFTDANLKQYKAIIFLSPTGNGFFTDDEKAAFQKYIHNGGGFVGIHAATDCLYDWEWYGKLVGAYFVKHPKIQAATLHTTDQNHSTTKGLPAEWTHTDEWYNFKDISPDIKLLVTVDEKSYTGGTNGDVHPISWYQKFEGGRVFYTALGHTKEDYTTDTLFKTHVLRGIAYALGRKN
ncbi:ThuA domain-containing protein [Mucilaginibacter sp. HMF5004]|uniref:ThuA domain-containing protein n=1 Tax=Mucilaginibacter rivuli TaxID=2857527 RepID=UPI001C5D5F47|nr:ThuA domain-containing protein [Mucilaginibacter rivuli]MBW4890994.1 ThuA domain-containing protein [Mucilaginibacter rivuli]